MRQAAESAAHARQAAHRRGERGTGLDEPGSAPEPAEKDTHVGERRLRGDSRRFRRSRRPRPQPGQREMLRGSNRERRLCLAVNLERRDVRSGPLGDDVPLRKAYPASSSTPATEARVPTLPARRMSPRTK